MSDRIHDPSHFIPRKETLVLNYSEDVLVPGRSWRFEGRENLLHLPIITSRYTVTILAMLTFLDI